MRVLQQSTVVALFASMLVGVGCGSSSSTNRSTASPTPTATATPTPTPTATSTVVPQGKVSLSNHSTPRASSEVGASEDYPDRLEDGDGWQALAAVDFRIGGANGVNRYQAWAGDGDGTATFIELHWDDPVVVSEFRLWDHSSTEENAPNAFMDVKAGRINFDNIAGSTCDFIEFSELPPDGQSALVIDAPDCIVSSVRLDIERYTTPSTVGDNIGLAEFQVIGNFLLEEAITNDLRNNLAKYAYPSPRSSYNSPFDQGTDAGPFRSAFALDEAETSVGPRYDSKLDGTPRQWVSDGDGNNARIRLTFPFDVKVEEIKLHNLDFPKYRDHRGRLIHIDYAEFRKVRISWPGGEHIEDTGDTTVYTIRLTDAPTTEWIEISILESFEIDANTTGEEPNNTGFKEIEIYGEVAAIGF